jgi:hypothetical protein
MSGAVEANEFVVVSAGLAYRAPGVRQDEAADQVARVGRVIALDAQEAARLTALEAIKPASDADRGVDKFLAAQDAQSQLGPVVPESNPYGGRPLFPDQPAPREMLGLEAFLAKAIGPPSREHREHIEAELARRRAAKAAQAADGPEAA